MCRYFFYLFLSRGYIFTSYLLILMSSMYHIKENYLRILIIFVQQANKIIYNYQLTTQTCLFSLLNKLLSSESHMSILHVLAVVLARLYRVMFFIWMIIDSLVSISLRVMIDSMQMILQRLAQSMQLVGSLQMSLVSTCMVLLSIKMSSSIMGYTVVLVWVYSIILRSLEKISVIFCG